MNQAAPTKMVTLKNTWCYKSLCIPLTKMPKVSETRLLKRISILTGEKLFSSIPSETDANQALPTKMVTLKSTCCHKSSCISLTKMPKVSKTRLRKRKSILTRKELYIVINSLQDVKKEVVEREEERAKIPYLPFAQEIQVTRRQQQQ